MCSYRNVCVCVCVGNNTKTNNNTKVHTMMMMRGRKKISHACDDSGNSNALLITHTHTSNRPRFGLSVPERIRSAVDLPIPFVPTRPNTRPERGIGSLERYIP